MTTPAEQRIDDAIKSVLDCGGITFSMNLTDDQWQKMRETMRKIMSDSYINGSNDNFNAMQIRLR
jgi:hypothetical protein